MMRVTELAHLILGQRLRAGDWVVDATAGNGHDAVWLASRTGPSGRVFGFDVQQGALAVAAERLRDFPQVTLVHAGHEQMEEQLPAEAKGRLTAVMFNLGYLPGAEKGVITRAETTIAGLSLALEWLAVRGLVTIAAYPGHEGGADETEAVRAFARGLPAGFAASQHARVNALKPAPELFVIERVR